MAGYEDVLNSFHSKFQSNEVVPEGLEKQFFIEALASYELDLEPLKYDETTDEFNEEMSRPKIKLLGLLMYKQHLGRYRDRALKLNNVIGRDIQLTGLANTKAQVNRAYEDLSDEIDALLHKLKTNNFE